MIEKINIMFLIDVFDGHGGTESHLAYLAAGLDKDRFNCTVVPFRVNEHYLEYSKMDFRVLPLPIIRYYNPTIIWKAFRLARMMRENRIDIVQTYHFLSDTFGVLVARLASVPIVISSRRDMGFKKGRFHISVHRILNRLVSRFITVSDAVGELITEKEVVPPDRRVTIRNGIDVSLFRLPTSEEILETRRELGLSNSDFVVGIVGHMRPEKGHAMFFEAACELSGVIPEIKFVVVGRGSLYDEFREFARKRGLDGRTVFTDYVKDARPYISVFDVACLTSRTEGFSNAILEYMAYGKPVVATAVGGNPEVIVEGVTGFLVPPDSPRDLAAKVLALHADPAMRKRMGREGRKAVEEKFSLRVMIDAHASLYESMMKLRAADGDGCRSGEVRAAKGGTRADAGCG